MPKKLFKNCKGFTLIEVVIYIGLFSIVIGGGMVATYAIIDSKDSGTNQIILQEEANFLLRKISWALTGSTGITVPNSTTLRSTKKIDSIPTILTFNFSSPNFSLQRDTGSSLILNSSSILISNLVFQKTTTGYGVTTTFTLTTSQNGRNATEDFSLTKYLRK